MSSVTIYLDENLLRQIDEKAKAQNRSRSNLIRYLIVKYMKNDPEEEDRK